MYVLLYFSLPIHSSQTNKQTTSVRVRLTLTGLNSLLESENKLKIQGLFINKSFLETVFKLKIFNPASFKGELF